MKKNFNFCLIVLFVLTLLLTSTAVMAERPVVKIASNVTLPYQIFWDGTEVKGYEAEIYQEVFRRAGYDVEIIDLAFAGILPGLLAEKWDIACSNIFITAEREETMDFVDPFYESFEKAIALKDSDVNSLEDLKGRVVGAETGTSQAMWAASLQEKYGPFEIKTYDDRATQYLDLDTGRIDVLAGGNDAGMLGDSVDMYKTIGFSEQNSMVACAVRPGDPIKDIFNKYLNELKEEGITAELYTKYYGDVAPEDSAVNRIFDEPYVPKKK